MNYNYNFLLQMRFFTSPRLARFFGSTPWVITFGVRLNHEMYFCALRTDGNIVTIPCMFGVAQSRWEAWRYSLISYWILRIPVKTLVEIIHRVRLPLHRSKEPSVNRLELNTQLNLTLNESLRTDCKIKRERGKYYHEIQFLFFFTGWLGIAVIFVPVMCTILVNLFFYFSTKTVIKRMSTYGQIHHKMKYR